MLESGESVFQNNPIALKLPRVETGGKPGRMGFAIFGS
jgi:hypothetical protein